MLEVRCCESVEKRLVMRERERKWDWIWKRFEKKGEGIELAISLKYAGMEGEFER